MILKNISPINCNHDLRVSFFFQDLSLCDKIFNFKSIAVDKDKIGSLCLFLLLKNKNIKLLIVQELCIYLDVSTCKFSMLFLNEHQRIINLLIAKLKISLVLECRKYNLFHHFCLKLKSIVFKIANRFHVCIFDLTRFRVNCNCRKINLLNIICFYVLLNWNDLFK